MQENREFMGDARTDEELLFAHRDGDRQALGELLERYRGPVMTYLVRTLRDRALAEEVFMDTFVALHRSCHTYSPQNAFRAYVFRIARNRAISALRRVHERVMRQSVSLSPEPDDSRPRLQLIQGGAGPERLTAAREQLDRLEAAVQALPENRRSALLLVHVEGLSYPEAAEALDVPLGTVKTWIHQARKTLRAELGARFVERG
ncbi:MAG: RNA polymerase sigma factor [Deltaproteobacteria bacterium]|nr:RNA polymerase sigma factor [Deltaproteobacteria bacterium]